MSTLDASRQEPRKPSRGEPTFMIGPLFLPAVFQVYVCFRRWVHEDSRFQRACQEPAVLVLESAVALREFARLMSVCFGGPGVILATQIPNMI